MGRLLTYLLIPAFSFIAALVELLGNYFDYRGNDPLVLDKRYQIDVLMNRNALLGYELVVPLVLCTVFLILLIFKLSGKTIRLTLGLFLMLAAEFWAYRSFFNNDSMLDFHLRNAAEDPGLQIDHQFQYRFFFYLVCFVAVLLVREKPKGIQSVDIPIIPEEKQKPRHFHF